MSPPPFLPYGRQAVDEDDIAAVAEVLRSDWLTTGPAVERFEAALAETCRAGNEPQRFTLPRSPRALVPATRPLSQA